MDKKLAAFVFTVGLAGWVTLGCGGGNTVAPSQQPSPNQATGSVTIFGSDAPLCDVLSFTITITGATLTPQGGGSPVSVISSANPVTVDFASLMDFSTVINFATVPVGTYSSVTLVLSSPQLTILDTSKNPPAATKIPTTLTTSTVNIDLESPIKVATTGSAGLGLDFNLRKSVQTDSQGQVTGAVTPVFRASPKTLSDDEEKGEDEELKGLVQSVTTTSPMASFIGSFVLQIQSGQNFTIQVTSKTKFEGISGLSALSKGLFVEVESFVDSNGNIVAKEVEAEEKEEEGQERKTAFVGLITSVVRNSGGGVTQFNLFVRDEEPDASACVLPKTSLIVNVTSSTDFKIVARGVNRAGLKFDSSALGPGQNVVVHGQCQAGPPPAVSAKSIFLRMQTILGNFSKLLAAGSDGKTGGFALVPCGAILLGRPITVFTFRETAFAGVADLNGLTPQPTLAVKGLLFNPQASLTVNGIPVTAPAVVFEAKQVHQLP